MDPFDLARFKTAQAPAFAAARAELAAGAKRTHWMWFMFPQLRGLGLSPTSQHYGISGAAEAQAYLADPLLGTRLLELFELALANENMSAREIFGAIDETKLRSCATLFAGAPGASPVFARALAQFFDGKRDARTLQLLARG